MIRVCELFCGIGGFTKGIEQALGKENMEIVFASEWDKYAASIYEKNFGIKVDTRDITIVPALEIPDHDLLTGGVPCQSWSVAGKRGGFDDPRGNMWFEFIRVLKEKQPKMFLAENVKGLVSHDHGKSLEFLCEKFCEMGYAIDMEILNSKNFSVPQNRERLFIVGKRLDLLDSSQII